MKMCIKRIVACVALFTPLMNLNAQTPDFSGVWVLKEKTSLSGINYGNGLPKQFICKVDPDSIRLNRTYYNPAGEYSIKETVSFDGKPNVVLRPNNISRTSIYKKGNEVLSFSIEVSYRDANGRQTSADFIEQWSLNTSVKELVIEKNAKDPDGSTWSMSGTYELTTIDQVEKGKGIEFTNDLSWEEIKHRAKKENKFIFVDCFATWCGPCKEMEREIFPLNIVGTEMNDKFISVRVQMDSTQKDNQEVQSWYSTAHNILKEYNIVGYPTFLFFDPDGRVVHKGLGSYKADEFISLVKDASNPKKQYYTQLNQFKSGKKNYPNMDFLLLTAKKLGESEALKVMLNDYQKNYLSKLPQDSLLSEKYLKLAYEFQQELIRENGSKDPFFKLFYEKEKEVDGILDLPGFSLFHINGIVTTEEIVNKVYDKWKPITNPQWEKIKSAIKTKYPKLNADQLILTSQIRFYGQKKDWYNQIKFIVQKAEEFGPLSLGESDGQGSDNAIANALLAHCDDKEILNKAVGWMEQIIRSSAYAYPVAMVYGNYGALLYKVGREQEGIDCLEKCLKARGYTEDQKNSDYFKRQIEVLERMKRGEKIDSTWNPADFN